MSRMVEVTELAPRDGHQSLLATRMALEDMVPACEDLDRAGYWSVECWGGATYDSCIRFLNEDPWERLRTFRKLMPNTRLQMLLRGQNLLGYRHYEDTVVDRFVEKSAENGMDVFRVFDALERCRNFAAPWKPSAAPASTPKGRFATPFRRCTRSTSLSRWPSSFAIWVASRSASKTWPPCCDRNRLTTWCAASSNVRRRYGRPRSCPFDHRRHDGQPHESHRSRRRHRRYLDFLAESRPRP